MSHTVHRRGPRESFDGDYIVFCMTARGFNQEGSKYALQDFLRILNKYDLVNMGDMRTGNMRTVSREEIIAKVQDGSIVHGVFADKEQAKAAIKELREADLGVCVNISGVIDDVHEMCLDAGVKRHTVEYSVGINGKLSKLPEDDLLEITTMCGHGMVSHTLVRKVLMDIKRGEISPEQAGALLATPCVCGIFNPRRAAMLLAQLAELWLCDQE